MSRFSMFDNDSLRILTKCNVILNDSFGAILFCENCSEIVRYDWIDFTDELDHPHPHCRKILGVNIPFGEVSFEKFKEILKLQGYKVAELGSNKFNEFTKVETFCPKSCCFTTCWHDFINGSRCQQCLFNYSVIDDILQTRKNVKFTGGGLTELLHNSIKEVLDKKFNYNLINALNCNSKNSVFICMKCDFCETPNTYIWNKLEPFVPPTCLCLKYKPFEPDGQLIEGLPDEVEISNFSKYLAHKDGYLIRKNDRKIIEGSIDSDNYVKTNITDDDGVKYSKMHQLIMSAFFYLPRDDTKIIDHIDRIKINNKTSNLQYVDISYNSMNRLKRNGVSSKYRGVKWNKSNQIFKITISLPTFMNNDKMYISSFKDEILSAKLYDLYFRLFYGENSLCNFLPNGNEHPDIADVIPKPINENNEINIVNEIMDYNVKHKSYYESEEWTEEKYLETLVYNPNIEFKILSKYPNIEIYRNGIFRNNTTGTIPKMNKKGTYYAINIPSIDGNASIEIHKLLAQAFIDNPNNKPVVDHKNRKSWDNRIENLRWATLQENAANKSKKSSESTSIYKGVSLNKYKTWTAECGLLEIRKYLGSYVNEEEAAKAYDIYVLAYYGEFACLNFSDNRNYYIKKIIRDKTDEIEYLKEELINETDDDNSKKIEIAIQNAHMIIDRMKELQKN